MTESTSVRHTIVDSPVGPLTLVRDGAALSIIVPCHRVVGTSGSLTGYAGGLSRKRFLPSLEEPPAAEGGRLF